MDNEIKFEGLLEKESGIFKKKSLVWVVLDTNDLSFYRQEKRSSCIGSIKVVDIQSVRVVDKNTSQFEVRTESKSVLFNASDAELADKWVKVIQKAIKINPIQSENNDTKTVDNIPPVLTESPTQYNIDDNPTTSGQAIFGIKLRPSRKSAPSPVQKDKTFTFASSQGEVWNKASRNTTSFDSSENKSNDSVSKDQAPQIKPDLKQDTDRNTDSMKPTVQNVGKSVDCQPVVDFSCKHQSDDQINISSLESDKVRTLEPEAVNIKGGETSAENKNNHDFMKNGHNNTDSIRKSNRETGAQSVLERNSTSHRRLDRSQRIITEDTKEQPQISESTSEKGDKVPDGLIQVQADKASGTNDVELRTKSDHSDVDISGVEMRKSRRSTRSSNRNNSTNESWSRSVRSASARNTEEPTLPEITIDTTETETEDALDEVFDIESILKPLNTVGINGLDLPASVEVTLKSEACQKLTKYLEDNSEYQFVLEEHVKSAGNSVEELRKLLNG